MPIVRIPVLASTDVESANVDLVEGSEFAKNALFDKYSDGRTYVTQRPGITINNTPTATGREKRGRGAHSWEKFDRTYQVINDTVYVDYSGAIGTIGAGLNRVFFVETDNEVVILDPENAQGWVIDSANVLTQITDSNFPPNQIPSRGLAGGGAWLDGNLYVLDELGTIWNSLDDDPTVFDGLGFIAAGRQEDGGVFLAPHAAGLVVLGTRTAEFFYNAGNSPGSPLARRNDVFLQTGALNTNAVAVQGNKIYFLGSESTGTLGAYLLENYQLSKISTKAIDDLLAEARHTKELDFFLSSLLVRGHQLLFVSGVQGITSGDYFSADYIEDAETYVLLEGTDQFATQFTLVFDQTIVVWGNWTSSLLEYSGFPVIVGTSKLRSRNTVSSVLFLNGEVGEITGDYDPVDSTVASIYFAEEDYVENQDDYIAPSGVDASIAIPMSVSLPEFDGGTMASKFGHRLELVGSTISGSLGAHSIDVSWSDDHYNTFSTPRPIATDFRRKLTRLGTFKRRAHRLDYEGLDPLRIEAVELDLRASLYAK